MNECTDLGCFNSIGGFDIGNLVNFIISLVLVFFLYNLIFGSIQEKRLKKRLNKDSDKTKANLASDLTKDNKLAELKEHLSHQEFIHKEALNYMEWTGYYITNFKDKEKLEDGVDGLVFRHLKTNEEKNNAKNKFKNSAIKVFTRDEINRFIEDKQGRENYIEQLKNKLLN